MALKQQPFLLFYPEGPGGGLCSHSMITTQIDIATQNLSGDGDGSDNSIEKAGIDWVLNKPFGDTDLKEAITLLKI